MAGNRSFLKYWGLLWAGLLAVFLLDLSLGSVSIPLSDSIGILLGQGSENQSWEQRVLLLRLPRVREAIILFDPAGSFHALFGVPHQPELIASDFLAIRDYYEALR